MKNYRKKILSILLCAVMLVSMLIPGISAFAADITLDITKDGASVTERLEVQEYRSLSLSYALSDTAPDGSYVTWESNLPLLAGVDDSGKVTGYDYSKAAVIKLWLDEEVRPTPIVGEITAKAIEDALAASGIDLETANTDMIVAIVSAVSPQLGESLRNILDNMNVKITARLFDASGNELASDTVEVVVAKSVIANVAPTGVHITNKKSVPLAVAVGTTVQLYGACTPVRLGQGIKWTMGKTVFDTNSSKHASVTADGLVTFTSPGEATVRVNPSSDLYAAFTDSITFTVYDPADLPVTDFSIAGETTVKEGETTELALSDIIPAGAYTGSVVWKSSDETVAIVDQNGIVTGLDGGSGLTYSRTALITATVDGVERSVSVTVKRNIINDIAGVEISGDSAVGIGNTFTYEANVTPARLNVNKDVVRKWGLLNSLTGEKIYANGAEADNGIAKINDSGVLTGLASGNVTIFVDAVYGGKTVTDEFSLIVGKAITDFVITGERVIKEGNMTTLNISSILPEDFDPALLDTVIWSIADPLVASIDENGNVKGLDAGGRTGFSTRSTDVTASIGGISRSFTITVKGPDNILDQYTGGEIIGKDAVVVDFPTSYTSTHTPSRINVTRQLWGVETDNGEAPWVSDKYFGADKIVNPFYGNFENSYLAIDKSTGMVTAKKAGTTTLWTYMANAISTYQDLQKEIEVVELTPKSITLTPPAKYEYLEGDTELDLAGMEVKLTYDRAELMKYYPEAKDYTEEQLTVTVSDYTVSEINPDLLDSEQYIIVTITRAGKEMRAIFPIVVKSKQVDSIEITSAPRYQYLEGETELDLEGLKVLANYLNAPSEEVTDYTVSTGDFDPTLLNVEQNITVTYTHAERSASATFPIIIYGIPVLNIGTGDYSGGWTKVDVTFTLDSTHQVDGITYYYKTPASDWIKLDGNTLTVSTNIEETYYFKAINGKGIESAESLGYKVSIDKVTPVFELTPDVSELTNQSYNVNIGIGEIGQSGIKAVYLNDTEITGNNTFTVDENGIYRVKIVSVSGLEGTKEIVINNIDKTAPAVLSIELEEKNITKLAKFINTLSFGIFFKDSVVATITAEDYGVAGIDRIEYRYLDENGNPVSDWAGYDEDDKPSQDPNFKGYVEARAFDKAANESESFCSDGYVIDGTAPTDIQIDSTTADGEYVNDTWTSKDVTLKLSSTAFSNIKNYCYRLNGSEWVETDGDTLTVSAHGISNYEFKAVSYSGLESNITPFTVKIDKMLPVIRVNFEGTFGRWTSGDVKFSFSLLDEAISGITYYYNNGSGFVEITSGDEINLSENVNATYIFKAVNGAGVESNPSDSYRVMIDNIAPTVTFTPDMTDNTTKPYDVRFNVASGEAGLKSVSVNGVDITGENKITVSENGTYVFVMTGNNGLTSTEVLKIENFISYEIKINSILLESKNSGSFANYIDEPFGRYFSEEVSVSIDASCNDGNLGEIQYRLIDENGNPLGDWLVYDESDKPTVAPNFRGNVEARAFDASGKAVSEVFRSEGITVDGTAPTAPVINTDYDGSWTGGDVTVTLNSTAYSGIYEYLVSTDGGEFTKITGNTVVLKDAGEHTYTFKAVSKAGLQSAVSALSTKIESSAPALSVGIDGTIGHRTPDNVVFTLNSPGTISGVSYYYNSGNGWQELDGTELTVDTSCDAKYTFKAVSGAGVESHVSPSYRVIVDKDYALVEQKPIINVSVSGKTDGYTSESVTFTLSVSESDGDVTYYYNDGNGWYAITGNTLTISSSGIYTYKFKAVDSKNRESLESAEYTVMLDKTVPTVSAVIDSDDYTNTERTAAVTATAGISGIKSITVNGEDITDKSAFKVAENGKYTVTVTANNGLSATTVLTVLSFDYETPTVTGVTVEHKNTGGFARFINNITFGLFFNEMTEITVTATDSGASGLWKIEYRLLDENSQPIGDWLVYDENDKPCVDVNFKGFIETRAIDNAGNVSETVASNGFTVDLNKPENIEVTATVDGKDYDGAYTSKDIVLTPNATAFSDINCYMYSMDNGEWSVMTSESIAAIDGVHTYTFKAVSNANLESDAVSVTTRVEKGAPELKVIVTGETDNWTAENVVFTLISTNGQSGTTYYYDNGSGWMKMDSNVLTVTDSINAEYKFKAVNGTGSESLVSDTYKVMLDKTSPVIEASANTAEFTGKNVTLSVKVENIGISGLASLTVNGVPLNGDKFTVTENGSYVIKAAFNNGKTAEKTVTVANIDREAPTVSDIEFETPNSIVNDVKIYTNGTAVTIDCKDNLSGVEKIEYRIISDESILAKIGIPGIWKTYDKNDKPVIDGDFRGYVEVRVTDNAGNASEAVISEKILVEKSVPTIKADADYNGKWTNDDVTVTLESSAYSGTAYYMYRENGAWKKLTGDTFTATEDGERKYAFKAVSVAGRESEAIFYDVKIEKTAPEIDVTVIGAVNDWTASDVTFILKAEALSGITYYYDCGDGWKKLDTDILTISEDTNAEYKFKAVNGAGAESEISDVYTVRLDKTGPEKFSIDANIKNGAVTKENAEIKLSAEAFSDIEKYQYSLNGSEWTDMDSETLTVTEEGFYSYNFRAVSKSGAVSDVKQISFTIDRTPPHECEPSNPVAPDNEKPAAPDNDKPSKPVDNPDIPNTGSIAFVSIAPLAAAAVIAVIIKKSKKK